MLTIKSLFELRGGIIILPPSHNPKTGGQYWFIRGGIENFSRLPRAKPGNLPLGRHSKTITRTGYRQIDPGIKTGAVRQGAPISIDHLITPTKSHTNAINNFTASASTTSKAA